MNDFHALLQQKYPEMKPVQSGPPLFTINGIGTMAHGSRDFDHETGTYVKTLVLHVHVFVPVITLAAYRVADAPPPAAGTFLGKVPLSPLAARRNWCVLLVVAAAQSAAFFRMSMPIPQPRWPPIISSAATTFFAPADWAMRLPSTC